MKNCQRCEASPADNTCHACYMKESHRGDMWQARAEAAESDVERLRAEKDYDGKEVLAAQRVQLMEKLKAFEKVLNGIGAYYDTEDEGSHACDYSLKASNNQRAALAVLGITAWDALAKLSVSSGDVKL